MNRVQPMLLLGVIPVVLPLAGCDRLSARVPAPAAASSEKAPGAPARVAAERVELGDITRAIELPGQVEAYESAAIHAKLSGYVEEVAVDIGSVVGKGDLLARIAVPELVAEAAHKQALVGLAHADVTQAEAAVGMAHAAVETDEAHTAETNASSQRAVAELARWDAELERVTQLVRESALTASLLDETRAKRDAAEATRVEAEAVVLSAAAQLSQAGAGLVKAQADVASARARVAVAEAESRRVQALLGYSTLTAPFAGVVTRRDIDPGSLTQTGASSEPLFVVDRIDTATVTVFVPEREAIRVEPGDAATIRLEGAWDVLPGKVTRTAWSLDPGSRTLRVEIDLPNPDGRLRPGLFTPTSLRADERHGVLTVPATAVAREAGATFVFVLTDGKARKTPVKVGLEGAGRVEVLEGIARDDLIATTPANLIDGQPAEAAPPTTSAKP